ncbi:hypothetical protein PR003_g6825 [Phytophthora rubi]|uniref:Uncharacterized protein n=1 Tax=Phytophthora rubi TaxID=129364 RepID=A0A6A4FZS4_9STRA|nr:hypothetical protein PR003_g6825 [Phytophthora rubi]
MHPIVSTAKRTDTPLALLLHSSAFLGSCASLSNERTASGCCRGFSFSASLDSGRFNTENCC